MSKAFTSESDEPEDILLPPPLPPGVKNYMTPQGAARLAHEIKQLQDDKNRLDPHDVLARSHRERLDAQLAYRIQRYEAIQIVDPHQQSRDRILFGARVTLLDGAGKTEHWRIVGIDEMNLDTGEIPWTSPLATALLNKKVGDAVLFMGRRLSVIVIDYPD